MAGQMKLEFIIKILQFFRVSYAKNKKTNK